MQFVTGLRCVVCGKEHSTRVPYTCPDCGPAGILDVQYDYAAVRRHLTKKALASRSLDHWRYRELMPVDPRTAVPNLATGWTPLISPIALARRLGIRTLYLKDDGRNPTGSFKDRPSSVGVAKAVEKRRRSIACASTGNAASSLAGMAAAAGLRAYIFVPSAAPEAKVTQLLVFGATVFRIQGSYAQAYDLCQQACDRWNWYNRNAATNPYLVEGKKTCGLEICEQMNWEPPDWVVMSVGDGCSIAAVWKAFVEMKALGFIRRTPKMLGVQAEGAAPVSAAFHTCKDLKTIEPHTIADSICVGAPANWRKALKAVRQSGGWMINVTDAEILDAIRYTGRLAGVFAEPAAAASVAGLRRAVAEAVVSPKDSALAVITGNGLKDVRSAVRAVSELGALHEVPPDLEQLAALVKTKGLV